MSPTTPRPWLARLTATAVLAATATIAPGAATAALGATSAAEPASLNVEPPSLAASSVAPRRGAALPEGVPDHGRSAFLLELGTTPTSRVFTRTRSAGIASARTAARRQLDRVTTAQDAVVAQLPDDTPVLYRTHALLSGVAVTADAASYPDLTAIPGVTHVYPIAPKSLDNATAVPLQRAPQAWAGSGALGQDTTVAIIDTGLDYTHATFGGPGTTAAYTSAHLREGITADPALFPNDKIVGGVDLVGDRYAAGVSAPKPDANPLDCNGHGSHVGGTVAGYGENADRTTYTGPYDESTPFGDLWIGPGMAPEAKLFAIRVFGCSGSTDVVTQALDVAMDPNGDGDPSDAVDVVNMSLGSDFGSPNDGDSVAADRAVQQGIDVVVSSGNSYDLYDVGGSPGAATRAITVASSADSTSILDGLALDVDGTDGLYGTTRSMEYAWGTRPDLSGEVVLAPADNTTACTPYSATDAAAVAGKVVLVTWTQEALECGSAVRGTNLADAGAAGFVFANSAETFSAGITGVSTIPGVLVVKSGGDAARAALEAGGTVTVTGTRTNAITQVVEEDTDTVSDFSSRGIRGNGNVKPDVAAVGASVFSAAVGTGGDGISESGTSMAAPMVAGLAALVRSAHPAWTPEQVKADIMNTAGQDLYVGGSADPDSPRYAPNRVGAGRIDAEQALTNEVLAYSTDTQGVGTGAVSVSYGPVEVTGPVASTRTVTVENTGDTAATYTTAYDAITTVPGVDYVVSPASVTVPPGGTAAVTVTLSIPDPTALTHTVDATHGTEDLDGNPLDTVADASGLLLLTPTSGAAPQLRVPVYSAPRPASTMTQAGDLTFPVGSSQATLALTGAGVDQGTGAERVQSVAAGYELQARSPAAPACAEVGDAFCVSVPEDRAADISAVGVTSDYPTVGDVDDARAYLAISTHAPYSTPGTKVEFDVYLSVDGNNSADLVAYTTRLADEDVFVVSLVDLETGEVVDTQPLDGVLGLDLAKLDSDTLVLPLSLAALAEYGVDPDQPRIRYGMVSYAASSLSAIDLIGLDLYGNLSGPLTADVYEPGLQVVDAFGDGPLVSDQPGAELTVVRDAASYKADRGLGLMMVHFHNAAGAKTQTVTLRATPAVTLEATPASVARPGAVALHATVTDPSGYSTPSGEVEFVDTRTGTVVATRTLAGGAAEASYQPGTGGAHPLVARYVGDASFVAASSTPATVAVDTTAPGVSVSVLTPSVARGGTARARVVVTDPLMVAVPTGRVTLVDAGTGATLAAGTLSGGQVTLPFVPRSAGALRVAARYAGDGTLAAAVSPPGTVRVRKASASLRVDVPRTVRRGHAVTVKVRVAPVAGVVATGRVVLKVGGRKVGRVRLQHGVAVLRWRPVGTGGQRLSASYSGDAEYAAGAKRVVVRVR